MAKPSNDKLAELFAELMRIEEHRTEKAEKEIQKIYKGLLTDLKEFVGGEYAKYAEDDKLTYAILQEKGKYAKFLETVRDKASGISPKIKKTITSAVEDVYKIAYEGMLNAVSKSANDKELSKLLSGIKLTQPQIIKAATTNPVAKLTLDKTLEKHRKEIVYSINKTVTIGIMNGDKLSTMADRISNEVGINYRKAMLVARTETHRVRETGHNDSSADIDKSLEEADSEYRMVKIWRNMDDAKVRHTKLANHVKMEGQTVLQGEDFTLLHGIKAQCPGQSGTAFNDCNCRCYVSHDLWNDEEYFKATGKHFPEKEPKKKQLETKNKLAKDIEQAQTDLQEVYDKYGVKNLEELENTAGVSFIDKPKAQKLEETIQEKQEKLDKKVKAAQTKQLKKQEEAFQKQVDEFETKTYSGIWKDDVTTADWKYKKDSIPKKKEYFDDKLKYATTEAEKAKWKGLLDDLEDFNIQGEAYNVLETQLNKAKADLTKLQKSGKIKTATAASYTQERKDAALWAKSTKEADKQLRAVSGEVWKNASSAERKAIYDYTVGSGKFNRPLSGFEKPWSISGTGWEEKFYKGINKVWLDFEGAGDEIRRVTDIISKSVYDIDVWLQRGCDGNALESFLNLPRGTFEQMSDKELQQFVGRDNRIYSFVSSAVSKGSGFSKPIIMNIYAPKGTQMMYCEPFSHFGNGDGLKWDGVKQQSSFGTESEMLIQRGASYTITKIEKSNGRIYIDLEIHPEDGYDTFQQDPAEWKGSKKNFKD